MNDAAPNGSIPEADDDIDHELLAALADEFAARYRRGERPAIDDYAADHPGLADEIRDLFPAMILLEEPGVSPPGDLAPAAERLGAVVGRYKLLERLGEGGFGVVFMAEQLTPVRRKVALKVIKPGLDTRQVIARFEAERQALALMDHENIARVLDAGATDTGRPYFVMELVRGVPITDYCHDHQLAPRQRLELFVRVCRAIQHAHTRGIIHRDLKPSNVLVTVSDGLPVPKVIDFGVAKATGREQLTEKSLFTNFAQMVGTPLYMSPEQAEMSGQDVDIRSDVYSLGVLLYELLTGTTPLDRQRMKQAAFDEVRRIIREEEPPRPSTRLSTLSARSPGASARHRDDLQKLGQLMRAELDWVVMKAMEKDPGRRYETAGAFAADLQRYISDEAVQACPPSPGYRFRKFVLRNKRAVLAALLILLALVAGAVSSPVAAYRIKQERLRAEEAGGKEVLRRQAEARENVLKVQQSARENLLKVQALCEQSKFEEAEDLLRHTPHSLLLADKEDAQFVLIALTDFHARHGRWKEALGYANTAIECEPISTVPYLSQLALLAITEDLGNYRLRCNELIQRYRAPRYPGIGEGIAKLCMLLPPSGVDMGLVERLADGGLRGTSGDKFLPYKQFAKGLVEFRLGHFAGATDWMHKSIDDPFYGHGHSRYVQSYMVLAMALHQLHEPEKARAAFAEGDAIRRAKLPAIDSDDLGPDWYWRDRIIAHLLTKEAEAMLQGRPAAVVDQVPH